VGVEHIFFAAEIEAAQLKYLLYVRLGIADAELVKYPSKVLVVCLRVNGPRNAVVGAKRVAKFAFSLYIE
jgi:hypothetical protein